MIYDRIEWEETDKLMNGVGKKIEKMFQEIIKWISKKIKNKKWKMKTAFWWLMESGELRERDRK